ncbi:MAG TPA: hemerythrin domain-containing protein [Vicinamibacteria bacterium]|nr:hemerythrin domain-containing protein [Vicinamibacteria bacterium]
MQETVTVQEVAQQLQQEHAELHHLFEEAAQASDLAQMSGFLASLHHRLTAHFNAEERPGGLYDTLGFCAPEFRRPLGQLVDDHFRLAATARNLRERARAVGGVDTDALRVDIARLVRAVAEHENRELEMVRQATGRAPTPARTPAAG